MMGWHVTWLLPKVSMLRDMVPCDIAFQGRSMQIWACKKIFIAMCDVLCIMLQHNFGDTFWSRQLKSESHVMLQLDLAILQGPAGQGVACHMLWYNMTVGYFEVHHDTSYITYILSSVKCQGPKKWSARFDLPGHPQDPDHCPDKHQQQLRGEAVHQEGWHYFYYYYVLLIIELLLLPIVVFLILLWRNA